MVSRKLRAARPVKGSDSVQISYYTYQKMQKEREYLLDIYENASNYLNLVNKLAETSNPFGEKATIEEVHTALLELESKIKLFENHRGFLDQELKAAKESLLTMAEELENRVR